MERLKQGPDFDLWLETLERPFHFQSPFMGDDFVVLIIICDATVTDSERHGLSGEIIALGCRYAVSTGHGCSAWDDAIDLAYLGTDPNFTPSENRLVMTTWHENEPITEVVEFFLCDTSFDGYIPKNFLILLVGHNQAIEEFMRHEVTRFE